MISLHFFIGWIGGALLGAGITIGLGELIEPLPVTIRLGVMGACLLLGGVMTIGAWTAESERLEALKKKLDELEGGESDE